MIVILLIGVGVIAAIALALVAYSANARKRAGQSGTAEVNKQQNMPESRAPGKN